MNRFIALLRNYFEMWFHKRNIIIVSEHKVKHIPISGGVQFVALVLLAGGACWGSYSTGSLMAARSALKEQTQALRSITSTRVENNFIALTPSAGAMAESSGTTNMDTTVKPALPNSVFKLSTLDNVRLFARLALLEKQVTDLQTANATIIQRVRAKTTDHIDDLEEIIRQTGLSAKDLKREYIKSIPKQKREKEDDDIFAAQGGPFIPASSLETYSGANEMFSSLDELATLRRIVGNLPLASPQKGGALQSGFGRRIDPFTRRLAFHSGLDIAGPSSAKIYSTGGGVVTSAGRNGMYGNSVDINHGFGISTRYGHMSEILVKSGQTVRKGEVIGIQGSTGRSTGPHVHYEVRYRNQPMNPKRFLEAGQHVSQK